MPVWDDLCAQACDLMDGIDGLDSICDGDALMLDDDSIDGSGRSGVDF